MEEALELFGEIANSKWLRPGADDGITVGWNGQSMYDNSFILFLNKVRKEAELIHTCP